MSLKLENTNINNFLYYFAVFNIILKINGVQIETLRQTGFILIYNFARKSKRQDKTILDKLTCLVLK